MTFSESVEYLLSLGNEVEVMKLGLGNIRTLLAELGDPQTRYVKVQVAGTNGKGSVCAFLNSICLEAGIKTGLYTSPHLISITERIRINGEDISEDEFARLATLVRETSESLVVQGKLETVPTYFEQVTAIGLLAFANAGVELAILETGLGGRYDAVTAANAGIAAITRVDLDHQEYLGDTIEEIAAEKAAIIRADSLVCIGRQDYGVFEVIADQCTKLGVTPTTLRFARFGPDNSGAYFNINDFQIGEIMLSLPGEHQIENAALAILAAKQIVSNFLISNESIVRGLERVRHPGRLEWIVHDGIRILLDGAHNPAGIRALTEYLAKYEPNSNIAIVYGSMSDKDSESMLRTLVPFASDLILTEPSNARASRATTLVQSPFFSEIRNKVFAVPNVSDAFDTAVELTKTYTSKRSAFVLVTGSLYLVGEVKKLLETKPAI